MPSAVVDDQPEPLPRPLFGLARRSESLNFSRLSKSPKKKRDASGGSRFTFANRLRNPSDASSCRPLISAPTDFRHLGSASGNLVHSSSANQVPVDSQQPNPLLDGLTDEACSSSSQAQGLRPLELSIHMPHNRLSSLLPRFEMPSMTPSPTPPPAYVSSDAASAFPSQASALRSYPAFSYHLPRKHLRESPPPSPTDDLQSAAPKAKKGRSRAETAPAVQIMKERVANAMLEMERLQKQIDDVVERQSMYSCSRPSSAHSMARTLPDLELEPMPSIPALPPSAPSFAERLQVEMERPRTAPAPPAVATTFNKRESSLPAGKEEPAITHVSSPPPPLPLVLRPPLRKKKSFSTVSKWLFSENSHKRDQSLDAVTNMPRPTKGKDGFYQSIAAPSSRKSYDSLHSHSTTDGESAAEVTNILQSTSPAVLQEAPLERCSTFGQDRQHVRMSVGVAI